MVSATSLLALLATASVSQAHVEFVRLAHNGVWQPPLKYLRNRTSPWQEAATPQLDGYRQWTFPTYPSDSPTSVRCGRDSLSWASKTSTLKVKAGDEFEFVATNAPTYVWDNKTEIQWDGCHEGRGGCIPEEYPIEQRYYHFSIAHDGPASVWLSRVPDGQDVKDYDGSGEWVKIFTLGVEFRDEGKTAFWLPIKGKRVIAKLPPQTPAGQYLLRVDQIYPGSGSSPPQHYPACAHIEVEPTSQSKPLPKGVKIPESLCAECPGMTWVWKNGQSTWLDALNGTLYPGGPIWDGETVREDKVEPVIKDWYDPW